MINLPSKGHVALVQAAFVLFTLAAVFLFSGCYFEPARVGVAVPTLTIGPAETYTIAPVCCNVWYGGRWYYDRGYWGNGYRRGWYHGRHWRGELVPEDVSSIKWELYAGSRD